EGKVVQHGCNKPPAGMELRESVLAMKVVIVGRELIVARVVADRASLVERLRPSKTGQVREPLCKSPSRFQRESLVSGIGMTVDSLNNTVSRERRTLQQRARIV